MRKIAVGRPLKSIPSSEERMDRPALAVAMPRAVLRVVMGFAGMGLLSCVSREFHCTGIGPAQRSMGLPIGPTQRRPGCGHACRRIARLPAPALLRVLQDRR